MNDSINIKLNSGSSSVLKVGFLFRAGLLMCFLIGAGLIGLQVLKDSVLFAIVCFAVCAGLFLVIYNILNAAFFSESLIVSNEEITIIHRNLGNLKKSVVKLNAINHFGFAEQEYTSHPMDSPVLDITGLATREKELQYVIDEGTIVIETQVKTFRFRKGLASWDVEEVVQEIEQFTGMKFKNPVQHYSEKKFVTDEDFFDEPETESEPQINDETSAGLVNSYTYKGDFGTLTLEQKLDIPSSEDRAFLNGKLAASGKYQIGEKQFVLISNGFIYAVRGFT